MSPLVFSLRVCGVLLAFCGWGPWDPSPDSTPAQAAPLASGAWPGTRSSVGGGLGPPLRHLQTGDSPLCVEHGLEHLHRWVRRSGTQPRRKLLRCLFGRWPLEDRRAEKEAATEPLRCDLSTGLLGERDSLAKAFSLAWPVFTGPNLLPQCPLTTGAPLEGAFSTCGGHGVFGPGRSPPGGDL